MVGPRGRQAENATMFYGEHEHTIDEKNRLTLPARFRHSLAGGVVLARGLDGNVDVYPREAWRETVEARIAALDPLTREARDLRRHVFSGAAEVELDRQGRVLVPPRLAEHAGLDRDVVVAGVHDHLEIWDRRSWETEMKAIEGSAGDVAERLADRRD